MTADAEAHVPFLDSTLWELPPPQEIQRERNGYNDTGRDRPKVEVAGPSCGRGDLVSTTRRAWGAAADGTAPRRQKAQLRRVDTGPS